MKHLIKIAKVVVEKKYKNPYMFCIVISILLNMAVETLSRKSFLSILIYMVSNPLIFLYNSLIIAATISLVLLIKRQVFGFILLSTIWITLGIINSALLVFRTTPFTAADIGMIKSAFTIMDTYLNKVQIIIIAIFLLMVIIGGVFLWMKAPKIQKKIEYKKIIFFLVSLFLLLVFTTNIGYRTNILPSNFGNIADAFKNYGFPYCFGNSLINTGIDKPSDYSEEIVGEIIDEVESPVIPEKNENIIEDTTNPDKSYPNIIFVQLESFMDPSYVKDIAFSKDPVPTFRKLKEKYTSGFLSVPSIGAGTANTEFEVITGMNLDFFGPGEYPYKTVLKETTCESIAYNLKELEYSTHAIHNNDGTFYDRNNIFSQLGFDTFTSLEYMDVKEYTPMGWAKDVLLTDEIFKVLEDSEKRDFVYTISVQGHGSYPELEMLTDPDILVSGFKEDKQRIAFEYYVNQLYEMDLFLNELVSKLEEYEEDTVLVLFGDHLPGFSFTDEDLTNKDIYQTEYLIWSNFDMKEMDTNLEAYQLSAYVMELLGIKNGILTKYHKFFKNEANYLDDLKILEYDMLYGNMEVF
ncbi:MAG: LTA synthase family protein, partial [Clostridiales bacterium]|nr:LTA synthase family protein [Clostridiales bacterium]